MRRRTLLRRSALLGVELASGCLGSPSKPPVDRVKVALIDVRQPELGATSTTLPLIVRFENPTDRSIPDPTAEFDLYILGQRVASTDTSLATFAPAEKTTATVNVIIQYSNVSAAIVKALRSGSFSIRLDGRLRSKGASAPISASYAVG